MIFGLFSWKDFDGSAEYHQTPKSLDILSLLNLTVEAKGDNSGRNNATDDPALRVSPVNYQLPEDIHKATEIPVLRFSPVNYQLQNDTIEIKSPAKEEKSASPRKKYSSDPHNTTSFQKYSSNKNGDKSDFRKKANETQFSLLDLLGEDGPNEKAEESPVHECHVAFSVEVDVDKERFMTLLHGEDMSMGGKGRILYSSCALYSYYKFLWQSIYAGLNYQHGISSIQIVSNIFFLLDKPNVM